MKGHDLEMSTNCLGPFLLNQLLLPVLQRTAASAEPGSVRVVWVASLLSAFVAHGGIVFDEETGAPQVLKNAMENYMQSKVGNVFLASEMARRFGGDGVMSLVCSLPFLFIFYPDWGRREACTDEHSRV